MKTKFFFFLCFFLFVGNSAFGQDTDPDDKSIIGTWVSEEDNTSKWQFTSDSICKMYSQDSLVGTFSFRLSNTSPQCGKVVNIDKNSLFLSLKEIKQGFSLCYYVNGILDKYLSLNYFDRGGVMLFLRSQSGSISTNAGYTNMGTILNNYGIKVFFKPLVKPTSVLNVGVDYSIGTLGEYFRPDSVRILSKTVNGRSWNITIKPDGGIYYKITSGSSMPANQIVDFGMLEFPLYNPEYQ